jgi:hypothetical protein
MALKGQPLVVTVTAWDTIAGAPKTGDAPNLSIRLVRDGASAARHSADALAEVDAANAPGEYAVPLDGADMAGNAVTVGGKSSTPGVVVIGTQIITERGVLPTAAPGAAGGVARAQDLPTPAQVRAEMDAHSTQLAAILATPALGGSGQYRIAVLVQTPAGDPVPNARLTVPGAAVVDTDTAGCATLQLDAGTYLVRRYASGYEPADPAELVVTVDVTADDPVVLELTPYAATPATSPSLCHITGRCRLLDGELRAAHQLTLELITPAGTQAVLDGDALLERTTRKPVSDASGLFDFYLERTDTLSVSGCRWRVRSSLAGIDGVTFELASAAATLAELLG